MTICFSAETLRLHTKTQRLHQARRNADRQTGLLLTGLTHLLPDQLARQPPERYNQCVTKKQQHLTKTASCTECDQDYGNAKFI